MADRKLGYIPPVRVLDEHRFRHVWLKDGTKKTIAHLSAHYDAATATPPPATVDYWSKASAGLSQMYRNDVHGCCVISGKDHLVNVWAMNDSAATFVASGGEVDADYVAFRGPGDNGCNITTVLDKMKSTGMLMSGSRHKIAEYVSVNNADKLMVQVAIYLFGGLTIGFSLPSKWYNNADPGFLWDVVPRGSSIVGGHDVSLVGYDTVGVYVSTWGVVGRMTWAALAQSLITECYAMLSPEWTGQDNLAPNGINVAGLIADMAMIENGQVPDPGPTPVPPTPPIPPVPVPPVPIPPTPIPPVPGPGPYSVWMCPAGVYVAEAGLTATLDGSVITIKGDGRR